MPFLDVSKKNILMSNSLLSYFIPKTKYVYWECRVKQSLTILSAFSKMDLAGQMRYLLMILAKLT